MELLQSAWGEYRLREFTIAVRKFQKLAAATAAETSAAGKGAVGAPGSPVWYNRWARFGQACCWNYRQDARDPDMAASLYQGIIDEAPPTDELAAWSAFDLVRLKHLARADLPLDFPELTRLYGEVAKKYPDTAAGIQALLFELNLEIAGELRTPEAIAADAQKAIAANPKSPYVFRFYSILAGGCLRMGRPDQYLAYMAKMLETQERDPANPRFENASAYWRIAYEAEFVVGDFETARMYYKLILKEYPRDMRIFGVEQALARMDEVEAAIRDGKPIPEKWLTAQALAEETAAQGPTPAAPAPPAAPAAPTSTPTPAEVKKP